MKTYAILNEHKVPIGKVEAIDLPEAYKKACEATGLIGFELSVQRVCDSCGMINCPRKGSQGWCDQIPF